MRNKNKSTLTAEDTEDAEEKQGGKQRGVKGIH